NFNSDWTTYSSDFTNVGSSVVNVASGQGEVAVGPYSVLILSRQARADIDSDGDGLLNGWGQQYFGDPPTASPTPDPDSDGMNNLQEQAADTNPTNAASVLRFSGITASPANVTLQWQGGQQARQVIQQATSLTGPWTAIYTNPPPTAVTNSLTVSNTP